MQKFDNLIRRYAVDNDVVVSGVFAPKTLCATITGGASFPGFLVRGAGGNLTCAQPIFLPSGKFSGSYVPNDQFEVLSR